MDAYKFLLALLSTAGTILGLAYLFGSASRSTLLGWALASVAQGVVLALMWWRS